MSKTIYDLIHTSSREDLSQILCEHSDCNSCPGSNYCHSKYQYKPEDHGGEPYHNGLWYFLGRPAADLTDDDYD